MISGGKKLIDAKKFLEQGEIKDGFVVADLGCGASGHFTFAAAHLVGEKGAVYAVDILKTVLDNIQSRARMESLDNLTAVWADLEKPGATKIKDGTADLVLLINTLFQVKNKQAVLREAGRVLKLGGTMLLGGWKIAGTPFGPPAEMRLSSPEAKSLVLAAGFQFIKEFEAGPYHYGLVFKKP